MKMARVESGMRTALAFYEAFNRHDVEAMAALIGDDCVLETVGPAPDGRSYQGREAIIRYWREIFDSSPDMLIDIEDIFGLGQRVVAQYRLTWTGTHLRAVDILRIQSSAITEIKSYTKGSSSHDTTDPKSAIPNL